jgi:serine/threonine protein kinase
MSFDTRVNERLRRYEELKKQGQPITPEELCRDCPELLEEVKRRLGAASAPDSTAKDDGLRFLVPSTQGESAGGGSPFPPGWTAPEVYYRTVRFHARGGLGEVFVVEDAQLQREVALKRLQGKHVQDAMLCQRFLREAEITGRLEHPGVVPVYGLVRDEQGRCCYVMRFIQGETLHDASKRFHQADRTGRDPGERSLVLRKLLNRFLAVCNTVAYAHSRGILHRDLKPANIMLGHYGETLVLDWGLAKRFQRTEAEKAEGDLSLLKLPTPTPDSTPAPADEPALTEIGTKLGEVLGTPAYMSPEQARGQWDQVGPATDIYSLGATLYTLLTGQPPFQGTMREVLDKVQRGDFLSPRQQKKHVSAALSAICRKAMALRPEDRYPTALALAADVENWLADEPVSAYPEMLVLRLHRWKERRHRAIMVGAASLLLVLFLGCFALLAKQIQHTREAAEKALAAATALEAVRTPLLDLAEEPPPRALGPGHAAYREACQHALCALAIVEGKGPDQLTEGEKARKKCHADAAVQLLGKARADSYFKTAADLERLRQHPCFAALQQDEGFQKVVREIEADVRPENQVRER